jgi:hypothetical protein
MQPASLAIHLRSAALNVGIMHAGSSHIAKPFFNPQSCELPVNAVTHQLPHTGDTIHGEIYFDCEAQNTLPLSRFQREVCLSDYEDDMQRLAGR